MVSVPRIVSLIASATEILHALGLGEQQVGRSHECDFPEAVGQLPVCTRPSVAIDGDSAEIDRQVKEKVRSAASVYEVFDDVLEYLAPTHIITQTQCKVCAVSLEDVERALCGSLTPRPVVVALEPNSLDDIWRDISRVANACGVPEKGRQVVLALQTRMRDISECARTAEPPRVACIEWQEPLMAAGNWVPELVSLAGGLCLFGEVGAHSPWMRWEDLVAADPDAIVIAPCGFDLARTRDEMHWMVKRPGWRELRAVRSGEVYLIDGNQHMNRPGPRIVESIRVLAEILHKNRFEPTQQGEAWLRWAS